MSVEDRLARLERENRRLKLAGLLMLAVIGSVFMMGQVRPPTRYEAESFILRDRRGVTIAALGTSYEADSNVGRPILSFYEPDGSIQRLTSELIIPSSLVHEGVFRGSARTGGASGGDRDTA